MTKKTCYKLVECRDNGFDSYAVEDHARVGYSIGIESVAPDWLADLGYHLLAFATLADAVNYMIAEALGLRTLNYGEYAILECEFTGEIKQLPPMLSIFGIGDKRITPLNCTWPACTRMYRSLTPVRRVQNDEIQLILAL